MRDPLALLADALRTEGGLLADSLVTSVSGDPRASAVAQGPRAAAAPGEYALVLAAVREGYLLHYDEGRAVRPGDPDLALLGGDRLYALGLSRLAQLGDVTAVRALADLISRCAQARAEGDLTAAEAAWDAAVLAVGGDSGA